jgi:hypothetical protein
MCAFLQSATARSSVSSRILSQRRLAHKGIGVSSRRCQTGLDMGLQLD